MWEIAVHDARLAGDGRVTMFTAVVVDANTPFAGMVARVGNYARIAHSAGNRVRVRILAHGFEDHASRGGWGIQICNEGLNLSTVGQLQVWKGHVQEIWIYSCAAADQARTRGLPGDGMALCSQVAANSGAIVRAAEETQWYTQGGGALIDFGRWEGKVYTFSPHGRVMDVHDSPEE